MQRKRAFQYLIIHHRPASKEERESGKVPESMFIGAGDGDPGQPTTVLSIDERQAGIHAARAIPQAYLDRLDEIEIIVRPF